MNHNMTFFGETLLFIGAHPDDIELGCGALIAEVADRANVVCVTLSDNQENPELSYLVGEHQNSMSILGVKPENDILRQFTTRRFQAARQEILEEMLDLKKTYHPEVVLCTLLRIFIRITKP